MAPSPRPTAFMDLLITFQLPLGPAPAPHVTFRSEPRRSLSSLFGRCSTTSELARTWTFSPESRRTGASMFFDSERRFRISALASYDLNHRKLGVDIRRGDTVQVQGGVGALFADL